MGLVQLQMIEYVGDVVGRAVLRILAHLASGTSDGE